MAAITATFFYALKLFTKLTCVNTKVFVILYGNQKLNDMNTDNTIMVFKVKDGSDYAVDTLKRYELGMFKGTRKEFNLFYLEHVGKLPRKEYMVYEDKSNVDLVEHGAVDRNVLNYKGNIKNSRIREEKLYLKR